MAKPTHYSPVIRRFLVSVLYHEAQRRGVPMTVLTNELLEASLRNGSGWKIAEEQFRLQENPNTSTTTATAQP